jgi:hypothetical protein
LFLSNKVAIFIGFLSNQSESRNWLPCIFLQSLDRCVDLIVKLLYCRIESYSCKLAGHEKQLYKRFHSEAGAGPHDLQVLSAPQTALAVSPTGGYFSNQRCIEAFFFKKK